MLQRIPVAAGAVLAVLATAASAQAAFLSLGTANTSNTATSLTGNTSNNSELKVTNSNSSTNVFALYGLLSATQPTGSSTAVRGENRATNGRGFGIYGSHAGSGPGVYGSSSGGTGVVGKHIATTGPGAGVRGESAANSASAFGVYGVLTAGATNPNSAAVRGEITGSLGLGYGVWGSHAGFGGGVYGSSASGTGVYGKSTSGRGVVAESSTGNALEASTSGGFYAGLFNGNLRATGALTTGVGNPFADGDTTPSVAGANLFETANTTPTTITGLDNGSNGQTITIIVTDATTTFQDGGNLRLSGNLVGTPDATLTLTTLDGSTWFEVTRSVN
jgi:trimeric autotransporter adhesin